MQSDEESSIITIQDAENKIARRNSQTGTGNSKFLQVMNYGSMKNVLNDSDLMTENKDFTESSISSSTTPKHMPEQENTVYTPSKKEAVNGAARRLSTITITQLSSV